MIFNRTSTNANRRLVRRRKIAANRRFSALAAAVAGTVLALLPSNLRAAARSGVVVNRIARGNVDVARNGGKTVIRASDRSIIEFSQFDLGKGEAVQFVQPSRDSRVMGRIESARPSMIDGRIDANGQVYLVNPTGIIFGPNAVINVPRIIAAAGRLSDSDFINGVDRFQLTGVVENHGRINGDFVALLGQRVENVGTIVAPAGTVALAAGDSVLLGKEDGKIFVRVAQPTATAAPDKPSAASRGGVTNSGEIDVPGGQITFRRRRPLLDRPHPDESRQGERRSDWQRGNAHERFGHG